MNHCIYKGHFQDGAVGVSTSDASLLDWLDESLSPWFYRADDLASTWQVIVETTPALHDKIAGIAASTARLEPVITFDQFTLSIPTIRRGGQTVLIDRERSCLVEIHASVIRVSVDSNTLRWRILIFWLLLELVTQQSRYKFLDLHASALDLDGRGILFAGAKHSGKTTVMLHCLRSGQCRWIANDRVFLDPSSRIAHGIPGPVRFRPATQIEFPELFNNLPRRPRHYLYTMAELGRPVARDRDSSDVVALSPAQFCTQLGVQSSTGARVDHIIFPSIDHSIDGWRLEALVPAAFLKRLRESIYGDMTRRRSPSVIATLAGHPCHDDVNLEPLADAIGGYLLSLGRNAYGDDFVNGILERLRLDLAVAREFDTQ